MSETFKKNYPRFKLFSKSVIVHFDIQNEHRDEYILQWLFLHVSLEQK